MTPKSRATVGSQRLVVATVFLAVIAAGVTWTRTKAAAPHPQQAASQPSRPNILWITSEDNGPQYGAYGDNAEHRHAGRSRVPVPHGLVHWSGVRCVAHGSHHWGVSGIHWW